MNNASASGYENTDYLLIESFAPAGEVNGRAPTYSKAGSTWDTTDADANGSGDLLLFKTLNGGLEAAANFAAGVSICGIDLGEKASAIYFNSICQAGKNIQLYFRSSADITAKVTIDGILISLKESLGTLLITCKEYTAGAATTTHLSNVVTLSATAYTAADEVKCKLTLTDTNFTIDIVHGGESYSATFESTHQVDNTFISYTTNGTVAPNGIKSLRVT